MRYKKIVAAVALLISAAHAQDFTPAYSTARLHKLADAIARAEGFGVKGARPTRNNNPGDIRTAGAVYPGQRRVASGRYIVFTTPAAGWAALHAQLEHIVQGRSKHYTLNTTLNQMAKRYAEDSRPWIANVSKRLGVPGNTTLGQYLTNGDLDVAPQFTPVLLAGR